MPATTNATPLPTQTAVDLVAQGTFALRRALHQRRPRAALRVVEIDFAQRVSDRRTDAALPALSLVGGARGR